MHEQKFDGYRILAELDDGKYALSWYETGDEAPSDAGLTSHL